MNLPFCQPRTCALLLLLAGSQASWAASIPAVTPALGASPITALLRVLGALALVFAVLGVVTWAIKNWQRLVVQKGLPQKLRVLEVKSLGQRHVLYVVGYEQQRLLLSASPTGVALLTALPASALEDSPEPAQAVGWPACLQRAISLHQR